MSKLVIVLGGLLTSLGCSGDDSAHEESVHERVPPGTIFMWHDDSAHLTFRIGRNGRFVSRDTTSDGNGERTGPVAPARVDALMSCLARNHACNLATRRALPMENEGSTWLRLRTHDLHCTIVMWTNEWYEPDATQSRRCIEDLIGSVTSQ